MENELNNLIQSYSSVSLESQVQPTSTQTQIPPTPTSPTPTQTPPTSTPPPWLDCGSYFISNAEQRSPEWHKTRSGRVTASNFGTCAGHSKFSSPDNLALEISGLKVKEFSEESKRVMDIGTKMEPDARTWYEKSRGVCVKEYGLAVPKWNLYIGGSPDGVIEDSDGIIEIKCPERMYKPLKEKMEGCSDDSEDDTTNKNSERDMFAHSHIWSTHYDQMQGCMAILNKSFCDYIVYCAPEDLVYVERIPFNKVYWETDLYPKIFYFIETKLKPLLIQQGIRLQKICCE